MHIILILISFGFAIWVASLFFSIAVGLVIGIIGAVISGVTVVVKKLGLTGKG